MSNSLTLLACCMIIIGLLCSAVLTRKKQCSRELFAFFAVFAWSGWWLSVIAEIKLGMELDRRFHSPPPLEQALIGLLIFLVLTFGSWWWMNSIHKKWPPDIISEKDYWRKTIKKKDSIFVSAWNQLCGFFVGEWQLPLYESSQTSSTQQVIDALHQKIVFWPVNALEILQLLNPQYKIDAQKDWYSDQRCYHATYGKEEKGVIVYCCKQEPTTKQINSLVEFTTHHRTAFDHLLFLIEQGHQSFLETRKGSLLVKYYYKEEMLSQLVNFRPYFQQLERRFEQEEIHVGSQKTLASVYTPLSAYNQNKLLYDNVEEYILNWATKEQKPKHLAVLGEYGQGKSVLSLKVSLELSRKHQARVPILIELRRKSPRNMGSIKELLYSWAQQYSISPEALLKLHEEGKLLLIFEGFDEMDLTGDRTTRLAHFRQLWQLAQYPKARILFTGRPNFFVDEQEQQQALGVTSSPSANIPYCELLFLKGFSIEQLLVSLRNIEPSVRNNIIQVLEDSAANPKDNFYQLIAKPATLALLTIVWKKGKFDRRKNQLNSALVIQEYLDYAYSRQQKKQQCLPLTTLERQYFMMGIAVGIVQQDGYSNQLTSGQIEYLVNHLLEHFPPALSRIQTKEELARADLKDRFSEKGQLLPEHKESILTDIRTCGVLVKDTSQTDHFKFSHKSFLEYLVALYYVSTLLKEENTLKKMTYGIQRAIENAQQLQPSQEVIQLIGELLHQQYLPNSPYSIAQYLYDLLEVNKLSFYFALMRKKIYLKPVSFLLVLTLSFFSTLLFMLIIFGLFHLVDYPISSTIVLLLFYPSIILSIILINKKIAHHNEEILIRTQIWYKSCQICQLERRTMASVLGSFSLKHLENYLRKIEALPKSTFKY